MDEPDIVMGYNASAPTETTSSHPMAQSVPIMTVTAPPTLSSAPMSQSVPPMNYNIQKPETHTETSGADPVRPTSVTQSHPQYYAPLRLSRDPTRLSCPLCKVNIITSVKLRVDDMTWILFIVLLLLFWPLCWLPFVMPSCQSADHVCPSCRRVITTTRACE